MPTRAMLRRGRFFLLEKLVLPVAMPMLRLIVRTWRVQAPDAATFEHLNREPRLLFATFHGMLLHFLGFWRLPGAYRRRLVVMVSPSLDGRLLATALTYFDVEHVYATSGGRSIAGSVEFIRRVQSGAVGMIAVDGPRGPCCIAKPGFLQIATAADARVVLATTAAAPGIRFGSWDRAHLPLPFARVRLSLRLLPLPLAGADEQTLAAAQAELVASAQAMESPVLPAVLRQSAESCSRLKNSPS